MTAPSLAVHRAYVSHAPKWQRYQPERSNDDSASTTYQRQYSHVYHARLAVLSKRAWENLPDGGGDGDSHNSSNKVKVERVLDLVEGTEGSCVAGTLVREAVGGQLAIDGDGDYAVYLEDESGRVLLAGTERFPVVTGVVAVVEGVVREGVFHVAEVHVPNPKPALEALLRTSGSAGETPPVPSADDSSKSILLLSGLNCGDPEVSSIPRDMVLSFVQGCFGTDKAKRIGQVIVAGGLLSPAPGASRMEALKDLDAWVLQLASCGIFVDVLPGKDDPTTANWPQRPVHKSLLPQSTSLGRNVVHCTPNPYAAQLEDDTLVMGTDGTNVHDLVRQLNPKSNGDDGEFVSELDALELILGWSHLCPNGPDSVPTVPHADTDPMVVDRVPRLLFSGNAHEFATSTIGPCRLVCVPRFSSTGQAVLVHLQGNDAPPCVEILCFRAEETN